MFQVLFIYSILELGTWQCRKEAQTPTVQNTPLSTGKAAPEAQQPLDQLNGSWHCMLVFSKPCLATAHASILPAAQRGAAN